MFPIIDGSGAPSAGQGDAGNGPGGMPERNDGRAEMSARAATLLIL